MCSAHSAIDQRSGPALKFHCAAERPLVASRNICREPSSSATALSRSACESVWSGAATVTLTIAMRASASHFVIMNLLRSKNHDINPSRKRVVDMRASGASALVKQVPHVDGKKYRAWSFAGAAIGVPRVTEREVDVANESKPDASAGANSGSTKSALCRPDRCHIEHRHGAYGKNIEVLEQRVQCPIDKRDIVRGFLRRQFLIDGVKVIQQVGACGINRSGSSGNAGIIQLLIQLSDAGGLLGFTPVT